MLRRERENKYFNMFNKKDEKKVAIRPTRPIQLHSQIPKDLQEDVYEYCKIRDENKRFKNLSNNSSPVTNNHRIRQQKLLKLEQELNTLREQSRSLEKVINDEQAEKNYKEKYVTKIPMLRDVPRQKEVPRVLSSREEEGPLTKRQFLKKSGKA